MDKHLARMNTLEVQIKKLMEFEKQARLVMLQKKQNQKMNNNSPKSILQNEPITQKDVTFTKMEYNSHLNELSRRIDSLEKSQQIIASKESDRKSSHLTNKEIREEQINDLIEAALRKKSSDWYRIQESLFKRITILESQVSKIKTIFNTFQNEHKENIPSDSNAGQEESLVEKYDSLLNRLESLEKTTQEYNPKVETIYIDKFILDKYEQNNNFAQLGIKELSGALNIGATYGKDVIPKRISEEAQKEIEKLKSIKADLGNAQTTEASPSKHQEDSSSEESLDKYHEEGVSFEENPDNYQEEESSSEETKVDIKKQSDPEDFFNEIQIEEGSFQEEDNL